MSYELVYNKQFIKVQKDNKTQFVPMIYAGSSNCTQMSDKGKERRGRSWWNFDFATGYKFFATEEEFIANAEAYKQEKIAYSEANNAQYIKDNKPQWIDNFDEKKWGYWIGMSIGGRSTRATTFGNYVGLFKTGCKYALTVEELRANNISVRIYTSVYGSEEREKLKSLGKEEVSFMPRTSDELVAKVEEYTKYLEGTGFRLYITINASEGQMERLKDVYAPRTKKPKQIIEVDNFFVVKDTKEENYVSQAVRNGYKYSYAGRNGAKKFHKESQAKRYAKSLSEKYQEKDRFVTEKVEETTRVYA